MKTRLDKELEEDVKFLNEVNAAIVQADVLGTKEIDGIEAQLESLTAEQMASLPSEAREVARFFKKHVPQMREILDWRELVGIDIGAVVSEIARGKFDKQKARALAKTYDELVETQENLMIAIFRLTEPRVISQSDRLRILTDSLPVDTAAMKSFVKNLRDLPPLPERQRDASQYWREASEMAFGLSLLVLLLQVLIRWVGYGLDEWDAAQEAGRPVNPKALQRLNRVTDWMTHNQAWIALMNLFAQILGR